MFPLMRTSNPPKKRGVFEHRKSPFWQAFQSSSHMWPLKGIHLVQLRETSFVQAKMEVFLSCESSKKYPWKCSGYTRHVVISLSISYACNDFLRSPQHLLWEFTFSTQGGSKKWPPILSRKPPPLFQKKTAKIFYSQRAMHWRFSWLGIKKTMVHAWK